MDIKIFKGIESKESYLLHYRPDVKRLDEGQITIKNEDNIRIKVSDEELYRVIDILFQEKLNASSQR